jgi:hypothetical protein
MSTIKKIHYDGNVGIGNSNPEEKLVVEGNIRGGRNKAICVNRGMLTFSHVTTDRNHTIYNNGDNVDEEGAWDGMKFNVFHGASFRTGNATAGEQKEVMKINGNGVTCINLTQTSDGRLKKAIQPIQNVLDKIVSLKGVTYQWKDPKMGENTEVGLIAQDVEDIFPEVVANDKEGNKSIAYGKMVAPLIEAIKEQQQQIEALRKEVLLLKMC